MVPIHIIHNFLTRKMNHPTCGFLQGPQGIVAPVGWVSSPCLLLDSALWFWLSQWHLASPPLSTILSPAKDSSREIPILISLPALQFLFAASHGVCLNLFSILTCFKCSQKSLLIFAFILPIGRHSRDLASQSLLKMQFNFSKDCQYTIFGDSVVESHGTAASMQSIARVPYFEYCLISLY